MDQQIKKFVNRLRLWIFGRQLVYALLWCLPAGIFLGAVLEIVSCFVPWYSVHYWAAGVTAAGAAAALIWTLFHYPSAHKAAMILDRTGLNERTVTALELAGDDSFFAKIQKKDAWEQLREIKFYRRLPLAVTWKRPCLSGALCILLAVTCMLPSPAKTRAKSVHEVAEQAKEQIEKVEKIREELEEELSDKQLEEYNQLFMDIQKELKTADTQEALEKALERAERKLEQAAEKADRKSLKDKLNQLSLALNPDKDGAGNGQEKEDAAVKTAKELEKAAREAEKMLEMLQEAEDLSQLSPDELEAAKKALEELAKLADNPETAASLQSAASQIASGTAVSSTLAAAQATVSALKQAAGSMLASNSNENQSGSGNNGSPGNNSGNGSGGGNGNGSGAGSGSGNGNGNGNGSGSSSGSGGGWNYGSKDGKEQEIKYNGEMVSVPNAAGDDENLTGRQNEGSSYVTQGGESLTWSGNSVEYGQVIGEYSRQALSQISNSDYPAGVQDIVKSYFEQLNQ